MPGRLLLIGGDSEIAGATAQHLAACGAPFVATTRRREAVGIDRVFLDLAAPLAGWQPPAAVEAACVFAAVARLQACEADPAGSTFVNVTQTVALVERLLARGIAVVFLSTNQVFDGSRPYVPAAAPLCPVSAYGRQKAQAEAALAPHLAAGAPLAILRLSKIVSPGMKLLRQWATDLATGKTIAAFDDMMLAPVPVRLAAAAAAALMQERAGGIFQLTGPRDVSYADVADHLARRLGAAPGLVDRVAAASAGMPPGATPRHTTLDSTALRERLGLAAPDVWTVIDEALAA